MTFWVLSLKISSPNEKISRQTEQNASNLEILSEDYLKKVADMRLIYHG